MDGTSCGGSGYRRLTALRTTAHGWSSEEGGEGEGKEKKGKGGQMSGKVTVAASDDDSNFRLEHWNI